MKMTLKEFFDKYPVIIANIAYAHNYSAEWLRGLIMGRIHLTVETHRKHLDMIQAYVNKMGREMAEIEFLSTPFNVPNQKKPKRKRIVPQGKRGTINRGMQ